MTSHTHYALKDSLRCVALCWNALFYMLDLLCAIYLFIIIIIIIIIIIFV